MSVLETLRNRASISQTYRRSTLRVEKKVSVMTPRVARQDSTIMMKSREIAIEVRWTVNSMPEIPDFSLRTMTRIEKEETRPEHNITFNEETQLSDA